ncbi:MAG: hypothetical protein HQM14_21000 [SAR324 cluster bacterium]|nr:hypothetical protein [SAR324 cluster bacterium]
MEFPIHIWKDGLRIYAIQEIGSDDPENFNVEIVSRRSLSLSPPLFTGKKISGRFVVFSFHSASGKHIQSPGLKLDEGKPTLNFLKEETSAMASSYLKGKKKLNAYWPPNLLDNDHTTAWVEGVKGKGVGESITFRFNAARNPLFLLIQNGYGKSPTLFKKNGRVKSFLLTGSDRTTQKVHLKDIMEPQEIPLSLNAPVTWIRLEILDVYSGSKYEDTCISEASFFDS